MTVLPNTGRTKTELQGLCSDTKHHYHGDFIKSMRTLFTTVYKSNVSGFLIIIYMYMLGLISYFKVKTSTFVHAN